MMGITGIKTFEFHHVPIIKITKIRGSDNFQHRPMRLKERDRLCEIE